MGEPSSCVMCGRQVGADGSVGLCAECAAKFVPWTCEVCGTTGSATPECVRTVCHGCEADAVWAATPEPVRAEIDDILCADRWIDGVRALRDWSGLDPRPGLDLCMTVIGRRQRWLYEQGRFMPRGETTVADLMAKVRGLDLPPVAIEASWDGDSSGWIVWLGAILPRPGGRHPVYDEEGLTTFRRRLGHDRDPAEEALEKGRAVAEQLGVPFHFPQPGEPDLDLPRWWDLDE